MDTKTIIWIIVLSMYIALLITSIIMLIIVLKDYKRK